MKDFLQFDSLSKEEIMAILDRSDFLKKCYLNRSMPQSLKNKKIALWFYGNGFRNRVAFELGAKSLGADVSFIPGELGVNEPLEDVAFYLDSWFGLSVIRCKKYSNLVSFASDSCKPVINARTEKNHPCEILGDLAYIRSIRGSLENLNVVFVGEVTNLCGSWFEAAKVLPIHVTQVAPANFKASANFIDSINANACGSVSVTESLSCITKNTDVLYTDCWPKNLNTEEAKKIFLPYQITDKIVSKMNPKGFYMPCPPVTRGQEISSDSLEQAQFCNYKAKEYLLHAQNAIMEFCLDVY